MSFVRVTTRNFFRAVRERCVYRLPDFARFAERTRSPSLLSSIARDVGEGMDVEFDTLVLLLPGGSPRLAFLQLFRGHDLAEQLHCLLCRREPSVCCQLVPLVCLRIVDRHAFSMFEQVSKIILGDSI